MLSADLIYIARKRAALTQAELARTLGLTQSQLSRWERGVVEPSLETLRKIVRACGLELTLGLANGDDSYDAFINQNLARSLDERVEHAERHAQFVQKMLPLGPSAVANPYDFLVALDRADVRHVVVGGWAAVLHGYPLPPSELEVVPAPDVENLERIAQALQELGAAPHETVSRAPSTRTVATHSGPLWLLFDPPGASGYSDLIADAVDVTLRDITLRLASLRDLIRLREASGRELDRATVPALHRTLELSER